MIILDLIKLLISQWNNIDVAPIEIELVYHDHNWATGTSTFNTGAWVYVPILPDTAFAGATGALTNTLQIQSSTANLVLTGLNNTTVLTPARIRESTGSLMFQGDVTLTSYTNAGQVMRLPFIRFKPTKHP